MADSTLLANVNNSVIPQNSNINDGTSSTVVSHFILNQQQQAAAYANELNDKKRKKSQCSVCHSGDHTKPRCPLLANGEMGEEMMMSQHREVHVEGEALTDGLKNQDHIIIDQLPKSPETERVIINNNAHIVKDTSGPSHHNLLSHSSQHIVSSSVSHPSTGGGGRPSQKRSKKDWNNDLNRLVGVHFPITEYETKLEYKVTPDGKIPSGKQRNLNRGYCIVCTHKSTVFCKTCQVYLCVKTKVGNENCFYNFHTKQDIMECVSGMVAPTPSQVQQHQPQQQQSHHHHQQQQQSSQQQMQQVQSQQQQQQPPQQQQIQQQHQQEHDQQLQHGIQETTEEPNSGSNVGQMSSV